MNKVPSLYMNQSNLPSASDYHGMFAHVHSTGRGYFAHAMNWYELIKIYTVLLVQELKDIILNYYNIKSKCIWTLTNFE